MTRTKIGTKVSMTLLSVSVGASLCSGIAAADDTTDNAPALPQAELAQTPPVGSFDGLIWTPHHDEDLRIIPVCSGPVATWDWLLANFRDHGQDIRDSLSPENLAQLVGLPIRLLLQIPPYAISDTLFHLPSTFLDILTYCSSAREGSSTSGSSPLGSS